MTTPDAGYEAAGMAAFLSQVYDEITFGKRIDPADETAIGQLAEEVAEAMEPPMNPEEVLSAVRKTVFAYHTLRPLPIPPVDK